MPRPMGVGSRLRQLGPRGVRASAGASAFNVLTLSPAQWLKADAGLLTDGAASFVGASSQYLSLASNATLQTGDVDQWFAAWFNPTTVAAAALVAKTSNDNAVSDYEWALYRYADGKVGLVLGNGAAGQFVKTTAAYTAPGWSFVFGYYDATAQTLNVSLNGGSFVSAARTMTPGTTAKPFAIGSAGGLAAFHTGQIDSVAIAKAPPGGFATTPPATIAAALYNAGAGVRYQDLTAAQKTAWGLVSWYDFANAAALVTDAHGANTLTNNNGVTFAAGLASGLTTSDGDPVTTWQDQSGLGRHVSQATAGLRPTLKLAVAPRPIVRFDGADDFLQATFALAQPTYLAMAVQSRVDAVNARWLDGKNIDGGDVYQATAGNMALFAGAGPAGSVSFAAGTFRVAEVLFNGAASYTRIDGGATNVGNAGAAAMGGITLGAGGTPSNYGSVDFGELVVCAAEPSAADRAALRAYLKARWGTA